MSVEKGKKENRKWDMLNITMSEFLDKYQKEDIYMVNDASVSMAGITIYDANYLSALTHFVCRNSQNKLHLHSICHIVYTNLFF